MFENMKNRFSVFGTASAVYALFYTFCLFDNSMGITYPFFVAGTLFFFIFCIKKCGVPLKKDSVFYMVSLMLLGISVCLTADWKILWMTKAGIFLLFVSFVLHQFYRDEKWSFGKYTLAIINSIIETLAALPIPFQSLWLSFHKEDESREKKTAKYVFLGLLGSVPLLLVILLLLASADAVFREIFVKMFEDTNRYSVTLKILMLLVSFFGSYCFVAGMCKKSIAEECPERNKFNAIPAVTATFLLAFVYAVFCTIQIVYLFLGKMRLPEGYTWASYAREGFFQLLAVCFINLVLVLLCLAYFEESKILKAIITSISLMTYILIASSAFRMLLYIQNYKLTFLRIFVLWSLAVMAVCLCGIIIGIFKKSFPLFRYCTAVVTVFYICLAFAKPDLIIASYNLSQDDYEDKHYLANLSADAVPAIVEYGCYTNDTDDWEDNYLGRKLSWINESYENMKPLEFNLSLYQAGKSLEGVLPDNEVRK